MSINLSFANGALGTILATDAAPAPWSYELTTGENPAYSQVNENCYHFCGTAGALAFPQMALWRYPADATAGWMHPLEQSRIPVSPANPLVAQLAHFCHVIRGQALPLVSGKDAAQSLSVVLAILDSAATQEPRRPERLFYQQE